MITKGPLKQLSEHQVLEMFDEASHNVFDLAKKYHNEGYDIKSYFFRQNISSDTPNNSEDSIVHYNGKSLLHYACRHKNYDIIKFLTELKKSIDSNVIACLNEYVSNPFPDSIPISKQIETDRLVLNLFRKMVDRSDIYTSSNLDFIRSYLRTKSINHQIPTVSLLITILLEYSEVLSKNIGTRIFNATLDTAINCNHGKDIILLLLPHCNFQNQNLFSKKLLPLIDMADKLIPVSDISSGKLIKGIRLVIMDGAVEHTTLLTDDNLLRIHIEVIIRQFQVRKVYLLTHTRTLSETQQTSMFDAAKEGDFSVALEFDKEGYDILTCFTGNSNTFDMLLYACLHDRLDLMHDFIDKGALFFIGCNRSMLSEYIIHTTKFNPEVATILIDHGIDIHEPNPIVEYYEVHNYTPLPDDMVVYFKQQGFSFEKCLHFDINDVFLSYISHNLNSENPYFLNECFFLQLRDLGADLNKVNLTKYLKIVIINHFKLRNHDGFKYNIDDLIRMGFHIDCDNITKGGTHTLTSTSNTHTSHTGESLFITYIQVFDKVFHDVLLNDTEILILLLPLLEMINLDMQYLISRGFNVNGVLDGKNVLFYYFDALIPYFNHSAFTFDMAKTILTTFVDSGADINYKNENGMNLLMDYLVHNQTINCNVVSMFIELGLDINAPSNGNKYADMTPLLFAIHKKLPPHLIKFLVKAGAVIPPIKNDIMALFLYFTNNLNYTDHNTNLVMTSYTYIYFTDTETIEEICYLEPKLEIILLLISMGCDVLQTYSGIGMFLYYLLSCIEKQRPINDEILEALVLSGYHSNRHVETNDNEKKLQRYVCMNLMKKSVEAIIASTPGKQASCIAKHNTPEQNAVNCIDEPNLYPYELTPLNYFTLLPTFNGDTVRAAKLVEYLLEHGAEFKKPDLTNFHILIRHMLSHNINIDIIRVLVKHTDIWSKCPQSNIGSLFDTTLDNNVNYLILKYDRQPIIPTLLMAGGVDFTKPLKNSDNNNLLILSLTAGYRDVPHVSISHLLKNVTTFTFSHTSQNTPDNPDAVLFRNYQAYKGENLVYIILTTMLNLHPSRNSRILVPVPVNDFSMSIPYMHNLIQLCIDYSMMYSNGDFLKFAICGSTEVIEYSKYQNTTIMYYYLMIMQLLTSTTKKQHQVRRLKKHLVRHNRSLTHVTSITSVRSCVSEDYSVVKMLHERYYNTVLVLHPVDHTSVLMYAAKQGFVPMVRWAISLGANVNAVDRKGMTALMYCCKYSQKYEVIELLLWHGADVGVKWKNRYTAFNMLYTVRIVWE